LRLEDAEFAFEQDPEEVRGFTLASDCFAGPDPDLAHTVQTMQLLIFKGSEDGNLAQLTQPVIALGFYDVILDGLGLVAHRSLG
jgi:hypothetical protein